VKSGNTLSLAWLWPQQWFTWCDEAGAAGDFLVEAAAAAAVAGLRSRKIKRYILYRPTDLPCEIRQLDEKDTIRGESSCWRALRMFAHSSFFLDFFLDGAIAGVKMLTNSIGLFSVPAPLFDLLAGSSAGFFAWRRAGRVNAPVLPLIPMPLSSGASHAPLACCYFSFSAGLGLSLSL
jgi:hypothetical protein